jgi:hypothetical protein
MPEHHHAMKVYRVLKLLLHMLTQISVVVKWVGLLLHIHDVPDSNLTYNCLLS